MGEILKIFGRIFAVISGVIFSVLLIIFVTVAELEAFYFGLYLLVIFVAAYYSGWRIKWESEEFSLLKGKTLTETMKILLWGIFTSKINISLAIAILCSVIIYLINEEAKFLIIVPFIAQFIYSLFIMRYRTRIDVVRVIIYSAFAIPSIFMMYAISLHPIPVLVIWLFGSPAYIYTNGFLKAPVITRK